MTNTTVADALTRNPGWSEYTGLQGTFPMGYDNDHAAGTTGGRTSFAWSMQSGSDRLGDEQTALWQLSIDGTSTQAYSSSKPVASSSTNGTVDITPPYRALVWLKKDF